MIPSKIEKIEKITEIIFKMRPEVGQHCWRATLFEKSTQSEVPNEIISAEKETENETVQKLCYEMDQMFIEEDFGTEDDVQELVTCSEQDEELITLELVPEDQEHKLPEKPQIQTSITSFLTKK